MPSSRDSFIDSLRGIAVLFVLITHAILAVYEKFPFLAEKDSSLLPSKTWFYPGLVGVILFFAISGFVITNSFKGTIREGAKSFIVRRIFRLFPLFFLTLPIYLPLRANFYNLPFPNFSEILAHFSMVPSLFGYIPIGPNWTLECEILFYSITLVAFISSCHKNLSFLSFMTILFSFLFLIGSASDFLHLPKTLGSLFSSLNTFSMSLSVMFWGSIWNQYIRNIHFGYIQRIVNFGFPLFFCIILPFLNYAIKSKIPAHSISIGLGIFIFIFGTRLLKISFNWLQYTGRISYSIYLTHGSCIIITINYLKTHLSFLDYIPLNSIIYIAPSVILTFLISSATYRWIELPCINWGKKLEMNFTQDKYRERI